MNGQTVTVWIQGVPIEAKKDIEQTMLKAAHKRLAKIYAGDVVCLEPVKCMLCEHRGAVGLYCSQCSAMSMFADDDYFVQKGEEPKDSPTVKEERDES